MILSISIPTYNRPKFLLLALQSIASQCFELQDVSIYISDDSDGVENSVVIEQIRHQFPSLIILYSLNPVRLGIDENIKKCIVSPSCDYVWLMGEDDLIVDGAIARILGVLRHSAPSFLFANYVYSNNDFSLFANSPVLNNPFSRTSMSFHEFSLFHISAIGFIGSCVINRKIWVETQYEKYSGSFYSHVGGIIDSSIGKDISIDSNICVLNRAEDVSTFTWSQSTFSVYFSFFDVLSKSKLSSYPSYELEKITKSASKLFAINRVVWLIAKRADGVYDFSTWSKFYRTQASRFGYIFVIISMVISFLPRQPFLFIRRLHLKRKFKNINPWV